MLDFPRPTEFHSLLHIFKNKATLPETKTPFEENKQKNQVLKSLSTLLPKRSCHT